MRRVVAALGLLLAGCSTPAVPQPAPPDDEEPPALLSSYGLFRGDGSAQEPADGVVPYDVNTPLFSDYAAKYRFVRLPPGAPARYRESEPFDFPVGTVLVKTFAYFKDLRNPSLGRRLVETRLLVHKDDGWVGLPYVWNDEQTEATLRVAGATREVRWTHTDGREQTLRYLVPNTNQCLSCHENEKKLRPIGPTARGLNRHFDYAGGPEEQLTYWGKVGILEGAPEPAAAPRLAVWNDPSTGPLEQRARAWLEMNCAHCHNPAGSAKASGLDLRAAQADLSRAGVWKTPVAAGRGSGGRWYDIVPGKPDASILVYRTASTEPGVMMPEVGRRLVDREGLALVQAWIASMPDPRKN
jgi:uncharacterized repeat protein (TIGR03806 family)